MIFATWKNNRKVRETWIKCVKQTQMLQYSLSPLEGARSPQMGAFLATSNKKRPDVRLWFLRLCGKKGAPPAESRDNKDIRITSSAQLLCCNKNVKKRWISRHHGFRKLHRRIPQYIYCIQQKVAVVESKIPWSLNVFWGDLYLNPRSLYDFGWIIKQGTLGSF